MLHTQQALPSDVMINEIIEQELGRRHWKLATRPELFDSGETISGRVQKRIREWIEQEGREDAPKMIRDAVIHEYSILLQSAIKGSGAAQTAAIEEACAYLRPIVLQRLSAGDLVDDVLSRALTQMWLHIEKCSPGSFLAWLAQIAINEAKALSLIHISEPTRPY